MNITKEQIDALNAVLKVEITKEDYQEKVDRILKDYRKNANIPGFRKGQVPDDIPAGNQVQAVDEGESEYHGRGIGPSTESRFTGTHTANSA